jgi:hypothetical protein
MGTEIKLKRAFVGYLFLLFRLNGLAQTDSLIVFNNISSNLKFSYNSSLIYPGLRLGIEFPINSIDLKKYNNTGIEKEIVKNRFVSANIGWYHHLGFHDNIYFTAEWTMRRTYIDGFFIESSFGPGYSRTFLGGTTYRVDNSGNVSIINSAGYSYAIIVAGIGLGYDLETRKNWPLLVFAKFNNLTMFPYNSTVYFRPVIELGLIYKPEKFIQVSVKRRTMKK